MEKIKLKTDLVVEGKVIALAGSSIIKKKIHFCGGFLVSHINEFVDSKGNTHRIPMSSEKIVWDESLKIKE